MKKCELVFICEITPHPPLISRRRELNPVNDVYLWLDLKNTAIIKTKQ
jgi:hypothetical protein